MRPKGVKETGPRTPRVPLRPHTSRPWSAGRTKYCETCIDYFNNRAQACPYCRTEKACSGCRIVKPLEDFYVWTANADGHNNACIVCFKNNLQHHNNYRLRKGQYLEMLEAQDGLCLICSNPPKEGRRLHIDHDHITGTIRGLLCSGCNIGLGHFADDIERLKKAIVYLQGASK